MLRAKLDAIRQARTSIRFEQYIFRPSPIGAQFRDALTEARRRGVEVTVLLDSIGSLALPHSYFSGLVSLGGRVVWFNPVRWSFWSFRDHRKILIVDDTLAFVGGCNIGPEYNGDGITEGWRDGGVSVTGPVVRSLIHAFQSQLDIAGERVWRKRRHAPRGMVREGEAVSLLLTRPAFHQPVFLNALEHDLTGAKDVAITMAYFLPVGNARRMLLRAARRTPKFRLLLPGKSDIPLMQIAARAVYGQFQRRGAEILEYEPQVLHAKTIIIDDVVYIGSANLDPRSLAINFEIMLRVRSASLAKEARDTFNRDAAHCTHIEKLSWKKPSSWWLRFKQKLARVFFTRLDLGVARYLVQKIESSGRQSARR